MIFNKYLKAWLTFNHSPTEDAKGNTWTTYGNPTIGTANAINGNALQLDGQSYIKLSNVTLGGQDFEIDCWVYVDSSSPNNARILNIANPTSGCYLLSIRKNADDATKLDIWYNMYNDVSYDNGYTKVSSAVSVGTRVHLKLIYRYNDRILSLCINDQRVVNVTSAVQYNRQNFDIYLGANSSGSKGLIGSIDEVAIYDGTWFSYNYGNVPTADYYKQIQFDVDTKKTVKNSALTWRYENYGTADLLTQSGTTVTDLADSQSKTGSAFYQPTRAKCFDIPTTKEIWIKCDIYTTANYTDNDRIRIYSEDSNGINGWTTQTPAPNTKYQLWHNGTSQNGSTYLASNKNRPFLLHMISDATNGVIEYFFANGDTDRFVGNVNNGADFDNVYIQMDGSNILVSNLIISNAPLDINDEVAELHQKTINFDTARNIRKSVTLNFDTVRNVKDRIWRYENYGTADLLSIDNPAVEPTTITHYSSYGEVYELSTYQAKYCTAFINTNEKKCFDIPATKEIWIKCDFAIDVDMSDYRVWIGQDNCKITLADYYGYDEDATYSELSYGETYTCLVHMISGTTDGLLEFWINGYKEGYQTGNINNGELFSSVYVATSTEYIWLSNVIISNAEIGLNENCKYPFNFFADTARNNFTYIDIQSNYDLFRNVVLAGNLPFDTNRYVIASQEIFNDTFRNALNSIYFNCDAARTIPHKLIMTPAVNGVFTDAVNSTGIQSIEIELQSQQLTDRLTYVTINGAEMLQAVKGQYLDYEFDMRIENINRRGILTTCQCCSDIDELLYTAINYKIPKVSYSDKLWHERASDTEASSSKTPSPTNRISDIFSRRSIEVINYPDEPSEDDADNQPKALASVHAQALANFFRKNLVISIDDFTSTVDVESGGQTYQDLIDEIFGWSARLPHLKINCYFRDNNFFVIQRGYEQNIIDITNTKHTVPVYNEDLIRTFWYGGKPYIKTETRMKEYWAWVLTKDNDSGEGSSSSSSGNGYTFDNDGLVAHSTRTNGNSRTETDYEYMTLDNGRKFLYRETTQIYENGQLIDTQVTEHTPLGQGQGHSYSTDETGDYLGSNVGRSKGDDRYSNHSGTFVGMEFTWTQVGSKNEERTIQGITLFDTSFPVYGEDKLIELTNQIKWLNRKVEQKISMDIYDYNHVIDFNDLIIFNGNEYHLESNTVIKTQKIVNKQSVTLIRWF